MSIQRNIQQIQDILQKYPRARLLGVTKNRTLGQIEELVSAGVTMIGESRVQEMESKADALPSPLEKHLIGHLQKNKVKKAVQLFDVIQSVDSYKLAQKISAECKALDKVLPIYLQVNISREEQKYGFLEEEILDMYTNIVQLDGVKIGGLMCLAKYTLDKSESQIYFSQMSLLYKLVIQKFSLTPVSFELSMGMSNDYEIALQEGATMIRVGSALFESPTLL